MSVYEMAQKYYPVLWPLERLQALVEAGRLTDAECRELTEVSA